MQRKKLTNPVLFILLIFPALSSCASGQYESHISGISEEKELEIPEMALKLFVDSTVDPCPICGKKLKKRAIRIMNRELMPLRIIKSSESCGFMRIKECGPNELVLSCYSRRKNYMPATKKEANAFPLVIFRFHTKKKRFIGISEADYSERKFLMKIQGMPINKKINMKIQLILYPYGDGSTFNFLAEKNQLLVHCKILTI